MPDTVVAERTTSPVLVPRSPLDGLRRIAHPGRLVIAPGPDFARLSLRGAPEALGAAFGIALPTAPCRSAAEGDRTALWLGPDEWLLLAPAGTLGGVPPTVEGGVATDVGHRQVGLVLDGPDADAALATGCPLDLHPTAFPVGMCTRTVFGKAEIVLWREGVARFHVEVWRSFAAYVHGLLNSPL